MPFRILVVLSISAVTSLFLVICAHSTNWQDTQTIAVQKWLSEQTHQNSGITTQNYKDNITTSGGHAVLSEATIVPISSANVDAPANINNTHPETILVLASMSYSPTSWLSDELPDILRQAGNYWPAVYIANSLAAPLHPPKNKGNEVISYLSYLIDFYDRLPEISIFIHNHPTAWHNNYLLDMSTSQMIRRLDRGKVLRDGYVNLRCHWNPGCPAHLHPLNATLYDASKPEELLIKHAWEEMFPGTPIPEVLAQPCCSQFAVTRSRIRAHSRETYIHLRSWLVDTDLTDYIVGRVFEYTWQYMFNATTTFCPDPRICYCEGYGICFEHPSSYLDFFSLAEEYETMRNELDAWHERSGANNGHREAETRVERSSADESISGGPDASKEGSEVRAKWLEGRVRVVSDEMAKRKQVAIEVGGDPTRKARAIEATRMLDMVDLIRGGPEWGADDY